MAAGDPANNLDANNIQTMNEPHWRMDPLYDAENDMDRAATFKHLAIFIGGFSGQPAESDHHELVFIARK